MTDDLTSHITPALDSLERLARYSGGNGRWAAREHPTQRGLWQVVEGTYDVATVKGSTRVQHVAHWDPLAVFDLISAHREILAIVARVNEHRYEHAEGEAKAWLMDEVVAALAKAHRIEAPE